MSLSSPRAGHAECTAGCTPGYTLGPPRPPTHSDLAPDAVQAGDALVALDALVASVALDRGIALNPGMLHHLQGTERGALRAQHPPTCGCLLSAKGCCRDFEGWLVVQGCCLIQTSPSHGRLPSLLLHAAHRGHPSSIQSHGKPWDWGSCRSLGAGDRVCAARLWMLGMPVSCCPRGKSQGKKPWGTKAGDQGPAAAGGAASGRAPQETHGLRNTPAAYSRSCFSWISRRC